MKINSLLILVCGIALASCITTPLPQVSSVKIPEDFAGVVHVSKVNTSEEFQLLQEMGVRWVLATFYWSSIERSLGIWDFEENDRYIQKNKDAGNKIIIVLAYDTPWLYPNNKTRKKIEPKDMDLYLNFVKTTVERYKDDVDAWEIWNEPNWLFWKGSKKDYFELHRTAVQKIRTVKKDAVILGGVFWRVPSVFINQMFRYGALDDVDAIAFHPYGINPVESVRLYDKLEEILKKNNFDGKIWITEVGYPTQGWYPNKVSEDNFPSYMIKTLTGLAARGPQAILWYELFDSYKQGEAPNKNNSEDFFGLLYPDFTNKKGARAYSLCANYFAGSEYKKDYIILNNIPKSIISYYFSGIDDNNILVLWNDNDNLVKVQIEGLSKITMHDITEKREEEQIGSLYIDIRNKPLFITWSDNDRLPGTAYPALSAVRNH